MFSSRPLQYLTAALFIVMLISAFYLEFPAITALVLTIGIAIWLGSRDGKLAGMFELNSAKHVPLLRSSSSQPSRVVSPRLLIGLSSFTIDTRVERNWRYPRAGARVRKIAREVLARHQFSCLEDSLDYLRSADCALLSVSVLIENSQSYTAITVSASVDGLVQAHRTRGSVSDLVTLWTYQQSRLTTAARLVFELEDCTRSCLYRLVSDLGSHHI